MTTPLLYLRTMKNENIIMVSDGQRALWQRLIAALFYTATLVLIVVFFFLLFKIDFYNPDQANAIPDCIYLMTFFFLGGLNFSTVTSIFFDLEKEKMKTEYSVGPFKVNRFSPIPELKYVSVFKKANDYYLVNLWYKGNKHFEIAEFNDTKSAFEFGEMFSDKLKLDLLDATVKGDSKWIEK